MMSAPVAIDLFCGAGGLSLGLEWAGFDVRAGIDFDEHALGTLEENLGTPSLLADAREVTGRELLDLAGTDQVDLVAGGPSCQGFSTHGKRLEDDERNFLYREFLRLVDEISPTTILMENVKGLLISGGGRFRQQVEESFAELGYRVSGALLLAADYGVPQRRERVFFIGSRLDEELALPTPTFGDPDSLLVKKGNLRPYRTVADAISDLPVLGDEHREEPTGYAAPPANDFQRLMRDGCDEVYNHVAKPVSEHAYSIISRVGQGEGIRAIPEENLPDRFKSMRRISNGNLRRDCTTLYYRLREDQPSYTITCYFTNVSSGAFTHPQVHRAITPREAARLQGFPDWFRFTGSYIPRQIGNAVPPLLGQAVGEAIMEHLRGWGA